MYEAKILADSIANDIRLTTFEVTLPRFLDAELNTHRMLSRNAASSRALPPEKLIEQIEENPFIPEFNERIKGMGVGKPLEPKSAHAAYNDWRIARDDAIRHARRLVKLNVDKSRVNRLLEPFAWHKVILTATDWSNFFALRTAENSQPEFRKVATMMQGHYEQNQPWVCPQDCWSLPLCSIEEMGDPIDYFYWKQVCTGRCARISYLTHDGKRDSVADVGLHNGLLDDHHMSPFEHAARPFASQEWEMVRELQDDLRDFWSRRSPKGVERLCRQLEYCGNFRGWSSYRAEIPNEHDYSLVGATDVPS